MSIIIITENNKAVEYKDYKNININACLTDYIKEEIKFGPNFSLTEAEWERILNKQSSITLKISLLNSLCVRKSDKIKNVITDYPFLYPYSTKSNGVIYTVKSTTTKPYVSVAGDYANKNSYTNIQIALNFDDLPVTLIENDAFTNFTYLKNIQIPGTISKIGPRAFKSCTRLENFNIPLNVNVIEQETFRDCTNLKKIYIPRSISIIDDGAFYNCSLLTEINYGGSSAQWKNINIRPGNSILTELVKSGGINYNS